MRYTIGSQATISIYTTIDAGSLDEAIEQARETAGMQQLCYHCASEKGDGEWVTSGELDGEATGVFSVTVDDDELGDDELKRADALFRGETPLPAKKKRGGK